MSLDESTKRWNEYVSSHFAGRGLLLLFGFLHFVILIIAAILAQRFSSASPIEKLVIALILRAVGDALIIHRMFSQMKITEPEIRAMFYGICAIGGIATYNLARQGPYEEILNACIYTEGIWVLLYFGLMLFTDKRAQKQLIADGYAMGMLNEKGGPVDVPVTPDGKPAAAVMPSNLEQERDEQIHAVLSSGREPSLIVAEIQHIQDEYSRRRSS